MRLVSVYDVVEAPAILYRLLAERSTEENVNISHSALPSQAEHMEFYLTAPYTHWELIEHDGKYIGHISATDRNEIGIALFQEHRGKGLGKQALELFLSTHTPSPAEPSERGSAWLANVHPSNERSQRLFQSVGFALKQYTYAKA